MIGSGRDGERGRRGARRLAAAQVALALAAAAGCGGGGGPPAPAAPDGAREPEPPGVPDAPGAPAAPDGAAGPTFAGCPVLPPEDPWNADVSVFPVDPASGALVAAMGAGAPLRLGFGASERHFGIPVTVVGPEQPPAEIAFGTDGLDFSAESDPGPYPIPLDAPIQGGDGPGRDPAGGDRHVVVVQRGTCLLFELYNAVRVQGGFRVSSAARFDLRATPSRPEGFTSADGAGLPIFPGLVRWDEASSGRIAHALRITAPRVRRAFVAPANHCGPIDDPALPPFGTRLRLRGDFDLSAYTGAARTILEALRRHGAIVSDVGAPFTLSGASDPGFADAIRQLRERPVPGSALEVLLLGDVRTGC
jgi:hypothetical protein